MLYKGERFFPFENARQSSGMFPQLLRAIDVTDLIHNIILTSQHVEFLFEIFIHGRLDPWKYPNNQTELNLPKDCGGTDS